MSDESPLPTAADIAVKWDIAAMAVGSLLLALFFGLVFNAPLPDDRRKDKTP